MMEVWASGKEAGIGESVSDMGRQMGMEKVEEERQREGSLYLDRCVQTLDVHGIEDRKL